MNKVILIGRLTKDPDVRFAAGNGMVITRFTIAINRPKQKDKQDQADFINCVAFGKTAEAIGNHLTKGRQIVIDGTIQTGTYTDKNEVKRYTTDVKVNRFEFIAGEKGQAKTPDAASTTESYPDWMEEVDDSGDIPF